MKDNKEWILVINNVKLQFYQWYIWSLDATASSGGRGSQDSLPQATE